MLVRAVELSYTYLCQHFNRNGAKTLKNLNFAKAYELAVRSNSFRNSWRIKKAPQNLVMSSCLADNKCAVEQKQSQQETSMNTLKTSNHIILEPTLFKVPCSSQETKTELVDSSVIQVSIHGVESKSLLRECSLVFPGVSVKDIIVVSTMQQAQINLVCFGDEVELEKERLLESVCNILQLFERTHLFLCSFFNFQKQFASPWSLKAIGQTILTHAVVFL